MAHPEPTYTLQQVEREPIADFPSFTRDDAVRLGEIAVDISREWGLNLAIDVHIGDELAYRAQLGSTGQGNADVIQRKILTAKKFGHSSLLARLKQEADPTFGADLDDSYIFAGGCIPIFVEGKLVGTLASSGEPDAIDHQVLAGAVERHLAEFAGAPA